MNFEVAVTSDQLAKTHANFMAPFPCISVTIQLREISWNAHGCATLILSMQCLQLFLQQSLALSGGLMPPSQVWLDLQPTT